MNLRLKRTPGIFLAGGAASEAGRLLAQRLGWGFVDAGADMAETCRSIESGRPAVVAIEPSVFADAAARTLALRHGIVFWLNSAEEAGGGGTPEVAAFADARIACDPEDAAAAVEAIATHPILR